MLSIQMCIFGENWLLGSISLKIAVSNFKNTQKELALFNIVEVITKARLEFGQNVFSRVTQPAM